MARTGNQRKPKRSDNRKRRGRQFLPSRSRVSKLLPPLAWLVVGYPLLCMLLAIVVGADDAFAITNWVALAALVAIAIFVLAF